LQRSIGPMVRIETRFPIGLARAHVDANQLELALLNLVVNARDALPESGSITIAAREEAVDAGEANILSPGAYVCLSVSDTGDGMDEAVLARAMEPFFTTKGIGKGTGLGLSMVHGLAAQSGGRLVLKSRKGEGTTAEIWLPVAKARDEEALAWSPAGPTAAATGSASAATVLAVDDDALVLSGTTAMLEDLGHTVIEACSGSEALAILHSGRPVDLVITDQAMPGMTGAQLANAIKAQWPDLPVMLATGYAELPSDTDPDLPKLNKPFSQEMLARAIAEGTRGVEESDKVVPSPATGLILQAASRPAESHRHRSTA
jgi:CheY-like chemotaxis protein